MQNGRHELGFALSELMVVVLGLGILTAVAVPSINGGFADSTRAAAIYQISHTMADNLTRIATLCGTDATIANSPLLTQPDTDPSHLLMTGADALPAAYQHCYASSSVRPMVEAIQEDGQIKRVEGYQFTLSGGGVQPVIATYYAVPASIVTILAQRFGGLGNNPLSTSETSNQSIQYNRNPDSTYTLKIIMQPSRQLTTAAGSATTGASGTTQQPVPASLPSSTGTTTTQTFFGPPGLPMLALQAPPISGSSSTGSGAGNAIASSTNGGISLSATSSQNASGSGYTTSASNTNNPGVTNTSGSTNSAGYTNSGTVTGVTQTGSGATTCTSSAPVSSGGGQSLSVGGVTVSAGPNGSSLTGSGLNMATGANGSNLSTGGPNGTNMATNCNGGADLNTGGSTPVNMSTGSTGSNLSIGGSNPVNTATGSTGSSLSTGGSNPVNMATGSTGSSLSTGAPHATV